MVRFSSSSCHQQDGSDGAPFSSVGDWQPPVVNSKRTSLRSRDVMARSLLKRVDDRRDQVTKQYMPPRKLDLIEELTQAPTMPLLHRDYPKTRTIGMVQPRRTRRCPYPCLLLRCSPGESLLAYLPFASTPLSTPPCMAPSTVR